MTETVRAQGVESGPVTVRTVNGRRLGNRDDAGRLCTSPRSPNGISGERYQDYVNNSRIGSESWRRAPGPVKGYRDPDSGHLMYDLDEVEAWNRARVGQGARTDLRREEAR